MTLFAPLAGPSDGDGLSVDLDPALLAFVKCHVTSALKWEALRVLAAQEGRWLCADDLARATHRDLGAVTSALAELSAEGVVDELPGASPGETRYRLPAYEPTTVVLRRLIAAATHSRELRSVIACHLLRNRNAQAPAF